MSEKLLIREELAHQSAQRQILEWLLFEEDVHAVFLGIQL
jgi:competence protein ComGF